MLGMGMTLTYTLAYLALALFRFWLLALKSAPENVEDQLATDEPIRTLGMSPELALALAVLGLFSLFCVAIVFLSERMPSRVGRWLRERPSSFFLIGFPYFFLMTQLMTVAIDGLVAAFGVAGFAPPAGFLEANSFPLTVILFALIAILIGPSLQRWLLARYQ